MKFKQYVTKDNIIHINWSDVKRPTESIDEVVLSDDMILHYTDWRIQRQLGLVQIREVFDTNVNITTLRNSDDIVNMGFSVNGIRYIFTAENRNNDWVIYFSQSSGEEFDMNPFSNKKGKSNTGIVISGVFKCIQTLIQTHPIEYITFGTDDSDLREFYTLMTPYVEKRLPLKLHKKSLSDNRVIFQYKKI